MDVVVMICYLVAVIFWILSMFNSVQAQAPRFSLISAGLVAFGLAFLIPAIEGLN
jgi:hypothetical protein